MGRLYSVALRDGHRLEAVYPDGTRVKVPVDDWRGPLLPGDASVLDRCTGATLDVGCGPGRLTTTLRGRGVAALGIDVNSDAVRLARQAGAMAHRCSVFGPVPRAGRWDTVLLVDGNIGIGGVPVVLLRRVAGLLAATGQALVEVEGPAASSRRTRLRLACGSQVSHPFPWAHLALRDVDGAAALAGLRLDETWQSAQRWFVSLRRAA
jgi:SAM-dependent methyltransferase